MNTMIEKVRNEAERRGACPLIANGVDYKELVRLFFSAQGREFCVKHNFPSMSLWSELRRKADRELRYLHIHIDERMVVEERAANTAYIGATHGVARCQGIDKAYKIVAMHGAKVRVIATDYAVVTICKSADCDIEVQKDTTAIILWE